MKYPNHHLIHNGHISHCQICNSSNLYTVLDLGSQPLCDTLLSKSMLDECEETYPLRMVWCRDCAGVQIDYCVSGKKVYHKHYPYRSGITKELQEYQHAMAREITKHYGLTAKDLVVDVGSNDGTLLTGFQNEGVRVLGVEPTNIAKIANKNGIKTVQTFFDIQAARNIRKAYGEASLIITTNTFAHMQTLGECIMGAYTLLKDGGIFVNETHYLLDVLEKGQFDTIYHEHLRTYSLTSLVKLFSYYDFTVSDVERGDRYGGNIRVYAKKGKGKKVSPRVGAVLKLEKERGLQNQKIYDAFAGRVKQSRIAFMKFLLTAFAQNKRVVGNSCPGRASTLLNYYGVDTLLMPYIAEQPTSLKLGMYLPGKHIPVVDNARLLEEQPEYVVLLAWHYADPIMKQLKARGLKSDFVIPLPDFRIVKNSQR